MQEAVNKEHNDNITDSLKQEFTFSPKIHNPKKYSRKNIIDTHIKKRQFSPISARHFERTIGLPIVKSSKIKKIEETSNNKNNDDIFNVDMFEAENTNVIRNNVEEKTSNSSYFKRENSVEIIETKKENDQTHNNSKINFTIKKDTGNKELEEGLTDNLLVNFNEKKDIEGKEDEQVNRNDEDKEKKLKNVFSFETNDDFVNAKTKNNLEEDEDCFDYLDIRRNRTKKVNENIEETDEKEDNIDEQILKELDSTNHGSSDYPLHIDSDSDNEQDQDEFEKEKSNDPVIVAPTRRTSVITRSQQKKSHALKDKIICVFPKGAPDAITLFQSDIDRLVPDIHLNDSIIDFYMRYIRDFILTEEQRKKFFFFNCFFFRSLTSKNAGYEKVKNWTRNVNIFDFDYIFIPINQSFHWKLAVICFAKDVQQNVTNPNVLSSCILLFDSLSNHGGYVFRELRKYLTLEAKRKGESFGEFVKENMPGFSPNVPKQSNTSDCGLFLLHYAEKFCTDPPTSISSLQNIKSKFNSQWFPPESVSSKRQIVLDIILQMASMSDSNNAE